MIEPPPMFQLTALVRIPARLCAQALDAVNGLGRPPGQPPKSGSVRPLDRALRAWRWAPRFNEAGDLTDLQFEGVRLGRDHALMTVLSPFVDNGCWIEMRAEPAGAAAVVWRWVFDAGAAFVVVADGEGADRSWTADPAWFARLRDPGGVPVADTWSGKPERWLSDWQRVLLAAAGAMTGSGVFLAVGWSFLALVWLGVACGVVATGAVLTRKES